MHVARNNFSPVTVARTSKKVGQLCFRAIGKKAKLLRFGRVRKNLFCSVQSAPAHLLIKSKIRLIAERLRI